METQRLKTKSNMCGIITGIILISVIYFLCKYKHENAAWAVVLIPVILMIILFVVILYKVRSLTIQQIQEADNSSSD